MAPGGSWADINFRPSGISPANPETPETPETHETHFRIVRIFPVIRVAAGVSGFVRNRGHTGQLQTVPASAGRGAGQRLEGLQADGLPRAGYHAHPLDTEQEYAE